LPRYTIPAETSIVTGFIDVHDELLYYAIVAWANDFTGYIIDYGTYPEQRRRYFSKSDKDLITLEKTKKIEQKKTIIHKGIIALLEEITGYIYRTENDENDDAVVQFSKILVDSGYVPEVVEGALRMVNSPIITPSKGMGVKATNKAMKEWQRVKGRQFGWYWINDRPQGRTYRTITMDVNYWKCRLHESFSVGLGARSNLTLYGFNPDEHQMLADHCNSEIATFVEAGENKKYEWQLIPGRDNHLFDCLVGCMVAASVCGVKLPEEMEKKRPVSNW
jgi:phage terminase large subunit GpA-like protein